MPKISVIVPVYKVEPYLRRCVDSILGQSFGDFELILVDDGSPDGCPAICDEYAAQDTRVRVIHKENGGVSSARNAGLDIACGEYVTFVDSDDWVEKDFLELLYHSAVKEDADMVICGYRMLDGNLHIHCEYCPDAQVLSNIEALKTFGALSNSIFRAPWCKLLRKRIVTENRYPTDREYSEDFSVVYKWIFAANKIACVGQELYDYFLSENGICRNFNLKWLQNFTTLDEIIAFFESLGLSDLAERYRLDRAWFLEGASFQIRQWNQTEQNKAAPVLRENAEKIYREKQHRRILAVTYAKRYLSSGKRLHLFIIRIGVLIRNNNVRSILRKSKKKFLNMVGKVPAA